MVLQITPGERVALQLLAEGSATTSIAAHAADAQTIQREDDINGARLSRFRIHQSERFRRDC